MVAVSVLLSTLNPGPALAELVRSIDGQTLPAADFEVVVTDASSDGSALRLRQLAGHRPNVVVLDADAEQSEGDRLRMGLARATGEYVVAVAHGQRLAPRALELLLDRATMNRADVVLARVVTETGSGSEALQDDADRLDVSGFDFEACSALVRRSLLLGVPDEDLLATSAIVRRAERVSAVGRYACVVQGSSPRAAGTEVSLDPPTCRWEDGVLRVTADARLPGSAAPPVRAWLVVVHDLTEIALPAEIESDERDPARLTVSGALDPCTAESGHPLGDGRWDLLLRLTWPGREVTLPLGPTPARAAVIAGRPCLVGTAGEVTHLDVGALRCSVVGPVPASRATVSESVRGALVALEYPDLHMHGGEALDARLLLDKLSLPARLVRRDDGVRLEAYVGAAAGAYPVSVGVGRVGAVSTGLRLRVDGTGGMALEELPLPQQPAQPTVPSVRAPAAQRLRRRVPGALEPLVRLLARVPLLRWLYRQLISR